ncbi:MAG: hypothetical protein IPQ02_08565 [Saprospiraceae bacterium]|nr:hypothetical protein [Candidatus Defluviibacterium haderslevense]
MGNIFNAIAHLQLNFSLSGIFIRGAIAISELYMDENIVVGPGLIEAYELENSLANFPRIILSKSASRLVKTHINYYANHNHSPQSNEYLRDTDGFVFLNYLQHAIYQSPDGPYEYNESKIYEIIKKHKEVIISHLSKYKDNYSVFNKYCWVAEYHNYFCKTNLKIFASFDKGELLIEEKLYKVKIKKLT